ncbi:hypothetical protein OUZ56_026289 [Daphnia magna]|uniref:Uncharacterized protein n=1 Tax=Daphnia magna TaxID=35525 RepID=A0ABQ9ZLE8_9CRUS|nr:hypothetical protein OUZ56_026289 [Daphnia magna]
MLVLTIALSSTSKCSRCDSIVSSRSTSQCLFRSKRVTVGNVAGGSRNDVEAVNGRAGRRPKRTVKHREILGPSRVAKRRAGVLVAAQQKTTPPKTPSPPLTTPFAPWISYVYPLILSWSRPSGTEFRYP